MHQYLVEKKGAGNFVTEVSMNESGKSANTRLLAVYSENAGR